MFRAFTNFNSIPQLLKSLHPARKLIVRVVLSFDILQTRMIRADQHLTTPDVRSEALDKLHNRQELAPPGTVALLTALQRATAICDHTLHLFFILRFHLLHLTKHTANRECRCICIQDVQTLLLWIRHDWR